MLKESGIVIFTLRTEGRQQTQLIIIPPNVKVPRHSHPNVRKIVRPIFGSCLGGIGPKRKIISEENYKDYLINAGVEHSVETLGEPFVYLSIQTWLGMGGIVGSIEEDWKDAV